MIAVVSSTVAPSAAPSHDGARTTLSPEVRLEQTKGTVESLLALGVKEIFVADNSPGNWLRDRAETLAPARVMFFEQPAIRNKGIAELWLLLAAINALPGSQPILKISGRYRVGARTELFLGDSYDVVAKLHGGGSAAGISTRCYLMRNREIAARLWERTLDEIYAERSRIVGPRSLMRIIRNSLRPKMDDFHYSDPNTLSIEQAALISIRRLGLRLMQVSNLDVEGTLGSWTNPIVRE
jgi:hypothetical protein